MHLLNNLTPSEVSSICLVVAVVALFLAIILTIVHYITGVMAGFIAGVAVSANAWWPMMQEWARDVAIPLVIGAGSMILWGCAQLYERFADVGLDEVLNRF
ncbi:MAG: hypothetical protein QGD90_00955 [Candidatus Hydrogenedentes bacterium]|nr:hypothetical protein [Candidatus Hydrogenedentota bacterium]